MLGSIVVLGLGVLLLKTCLTHVSYADNGSHCARNRLFRGFYDDSTLIAEHYAGKSYGLILGVFTMIDTLAGSIGIRTIGQLRASTGSYNTSFEVMLAFVLSL
jgi:hypothetical protein